MERQTEWRGSRDTSRRRLYRLLALSVLIHAPLTPVAAIFGLVSLLMRAAPTDEGGHVEPLTAIPIDLIADDSEGVATPNEPSAKTAANPGTDPAKAPDKGEDGEPTLDTEGPDGGAEKLARPGDAGTEAGGTIGDPVALAGAAGKVVDSNANVRVIVFADRIRNHPMGVRIGELLGAADQWQDFFGPTGLDPINDVDRILIAGPQLRDSAEVVAVIRTNVSDDKLKSAVDALVKRDDQGGWLDAGIPAAHARADRAGRLFVMPAPHMLVVAPPSVEKQALSLGSSLKFPNPQGSEALTTYVVAPWRAFVGIPFKVPESIKWVRMRVTPTADGGATAEIIAEDESEETAQKNAEMLTTAVNTVTSPKLGIVGALIGKKELKLLEPVTFTAQGKQIRGTVVATPKQLRALLEAVAAYAKQVGEEAAKKRAAKAAAAAAATDAGIAPEPAPAPQKKAAPNAEPPSGPAERPKAPPAENPPEKAPGPKPE